MKEKQAEVVASAEGFDPMLLAPAVTEAGFVAPGAEVGIDVNAVGEIEVDGNETFFVMLGSRWRLAGESVAELVPGQKPREVHGRLFLREGDVMPTLEILPETGD